MTCKLDKAICRLCYKNSFRKWTNMCEWLWRRGRLQCVGAKGMISTMAVSTKCLFGAEQVVSKQEGVAS